MASAARSVAASETPCAIPSLSAVEAGGQASLPIWAQTPQARSILTAIKAERPERTHTITQTTTGGRGEVGYAGRNAAQLRALFDRTWDSLISWCEAARPASLPGGRTVHSPLYEQRREAVSAYRRDFGADAVIAKMLGDNR